MHGGKVNSLARFVNQIFIRENILVIRRLHDPERELTIVPTTRVEQIIRFSHKGPDDAHQALTETSARIISCFE